MSIEIFPGAVKFDFPKEIAKESINKVEKSKFLWVDSTVGQGSLSKHIRSSQSFNIDELDISKDKIRPFLSECVKKYSDYYEVEVSNDEGLNLLRYETYDKYEFHTDHGPGLNRSVSCLIYLNPDQYEGGGTTFKHFNYTISPIAPSLVLFPSNYPYLHAAEPVTKGVKFIIVTWMND
jgi:predicted 2-oxoglutarate/Fe(II)-dependent dioxygenase YbiX